MVYSLEYIWHVTQPSQVHTLRLSHCGDSLLKHMNDISWNIQLKSCVSLTKDNLYNQWYILILGTYLDLKVGTVSAA